MLASLSIMNRNGLPKVIEPKKETLSGIGDL